MPDRPDILTAEQLARDIAGGVGDDREGWYGAAEALALARAYLRLREQRDEWQNEAEQRSEWARQQLNAEKARLARVTAAAEYVRDARDIEDVDDAHLTNALDRLEEALVAVEETAE